MDVLTLIPDVQQMVAIICVAGLMPMLTITVAAMLLRQLRHISMFPWWPWGTGQE
jgi:hypothetical protein